MPRLPNGNWQEYTPGNPVVTNTTIASAWWNGTYMDLGGALQDSLSRSGLGGMLVPFTLVDGTVSTPAFAFQNENNTGFYRANPGDMRVSVLGADVFKWTSTAVTALESVVVTGTASTTGLSATGGTGNADGISGTATGTGAGIHGFSSSTSGSVALVGTGTGGQLGLLAASSAANVDVLRADGYVDLSHAASVAVNTAFTNRVTPKNVCKAWVLCHTDGAGNVTAVDGFNIASASISSATLTVGWASNFASTNYSVVASAGAAAVGQPVVILNTRAIGSCSVKLWDVNAASLYNLATVAMDISVHVFGAQ